MISSTTHTQPCDAHQLPDASHNSSITNHQGSAGSRSVSAQSDATGTVRHNTNSGAGSYVRSAATFVASTALALLNNVATTVGQNISAVNATTAVPMNNGTSAVLINNGTTAAPTEECGNPLYEDILIGTSAGLLGLVVITTVVCGVKSYLKRSSSEMDEKSSASAAGPEAGKNEKAFADLPEKSMV